jgi:hypothetical protein
LREAYIDTTIKDWSVRAGKQQVVWGTADGIKLLDMINPTDYAEMAQNQMEDSRIPVWMINAEKDFENGGNLQVILSQPRENVFAGLNRGIDTQARANATTPNAQGVFVDLTTKNGHNSNHAFMMKGVDSITGETNGFLNIAPDLGSVARAFANGFGAINSLAGAGMENFTVDIFESLNMEGMSNQLAGGACGGGGISCLPANFQAAVNQVATALGKASTAVTGEEMLAYGFAQAYDTNLVNYTTSSKDSAFDYMGATTFKTFDAFVNAKSQYVYNMPDDTDLDIAFRFKNSTENGLNYSINTSYNYDKNPIIDLNWVNDAGEKLFTVETVATNTSLAINSKSDGTGVAYGGAAGRAATLKFSQEVKRVKQIGGSFDTAIETDSLGSVVLRGEALYTKDGYSPVMSIDRLAIGDLVGALQMKKADRFKYVVGVDITVLTNMLVSTQFIQDRNLDFVDDASGYTTDYATMHLSNGFQKAEKNKEFYSLFFSKPFGSSGEHRWNNIFMFEENGGKWNRFDVEYSINDDMVATAEYNKYWGDENTQFGQLEKSSNIQLGFKYSF